MKMTFCFSIQTIRDSVVLLMPSTDLLFLTYFTGLNIIKSKYNCHVHFTYGRYANHMLIIYILSGICILPIQQIC